jgi:hypothetical protein
MTPTGHVGVKGGVDDVQTGAHCARETAAVAQRRGVTELMETSRGNGRGQDDQQQSRRVQRVVDTRRHPMHEVQPGFERQRHSDADQQYAGPVEPAQRSNQRGDTPPIECAHAHAQLQQRLLASAGVDQPAVAERDQALRDELSEDQLAHVVGADRPPRCL